MNTITTGICEIKITPDEDSAIVEISHYGITDVEFTLNPEQREELAVMLAPRYGRLEAENERLKTELAAYKTEVTRLQNKEDKYLSEKLTRITEALQSEAPQEPLTPDE